MGWEGPPAFAVKFTIRDSRDRAGREYAALVALEEADLELAPRGVLLERERFARPVVVQTWLRGKTSAVPPTSEDEWGALLSHFARLHAVTTSGIRDGVSTGLRPAVLTATSAAEAWSRIAEQRAHIPEEAQPDSLGALLSRLERANFPEWPAPPRALCRCDPNITNFVRRPAAWSSVDWENSGWGDPAFEVADLITHASYLDVPYEQWDWVADSYISLRAKSLRGTRETGESLTTRIGVYRTLLLAWWATRLARALYEVPRGLDQRLVAREATWQADTVAKYERYVRLADAQLKCGASS